VLKITTCQELLVLPNVQLDTMETILPGHVEHVTQLVTLVLEVHLPIVLLVSITFGYVMKQENVSLNAQNPGMETENVDVVNSV
jgi:hypothetical protein